MAESALDQIQRLVEQLSPPEQAHLLSTLALRMAHVMTSMSSPASTAPPADVVAWEEFFRIGDTLALGDTKETDTMTAAVLSMRR